MATTGRRLGSHAAPPRQPSPPSEQPGFFKFVLLVDLQSKTLRIPRKFVSMYGSQLSDVVTLSIPAGLKWQVGLKRGKNDFWFNDYWHEFVQHHSIREWYFLTFEYRGSSSFEVHVFGLDSYEISYPVSYNLVGGEDKHLGKRGNEETWAPISGCKMTGNGRKNPRAESGEAEIIVSARLGSCRMDAITKAKSLKPKNPSFLIILTDSSIRLDTVNIPSEFRRKYLNNVSECIEIEDPKGRKRWIGIGNEGSYKRLRRGWYELMKINELKAEDLCVFELVKRKHNVGLKLRVIRSS